MPSSRTNGRRRLQRKTTAARGANSIIYGGIPSSAAAVAALLIATAAHGTPPAACIAVIGYPEEKALAFVPLPVDDPTFAITYRHSVTRTPVTETYRATADRFVQTSIRFEQHGPGLPTAPGPGERWERMDGRFVVTMARPLDDIRMRVHADQAPALDVAGATLALTRWGNRAIGLLPSTCTAEPR
jgi:hypothetical protein